MLSFPAERIDRRQFILYVAIVLLVNVALVFVLPANIARYAGTGITLLLLLGLVARAHDLGISAWISVPVAVIFGMIFPLVIVFANMSTFVAGLNHDAPTHKTEVMWPIFLTAYAPIVLIFIAAMLIPGQIGPNRFGTRRSIFRNTDSQPA